MQKRPFYQDRLGTNIGIVERKKRRFVHAGAYFRRYGGCCHPRLVNSNNQGVHHGLSHPSRGTLHA